MFFRKGKGVLLVGVKPLTVVMDPGIDITILLSSRENQISTYLKDKGYSIFTYVFYKTLISGDVFDKDEDGWIDVFEIKDYLIKKIKKLSSKKGMMQVPVIGAIDAKLCPPAE